MGDKSDHSARSRLHVARLMDQDGRRTLGSGAGLLRPAAERIVNFRALHPCYLGVLTKVSARHVVRVTLCGDIAGRKDEAYVYVRSEHQIIDWLKLQCKLSARTDRSVTASAEQSVNLST